MNPLSLGQNGPQRAVGVQYITGSPPSTPVLRPLRQPMWDTEIYPAAGVARLNLFVNESAFATGAAKTVTDTNMTQPRSLGTPLEFDLIGFITELQRGTSLANHNTIYADGLFEWIFGQNTRWLTVPIRKIPEGIGQAGSASVDTGVAATLVQEEIVSNGQPTAQQFYNFTTPDMKARRITSTENFQNVILFNAAAALTAPASPVEVTTYMLGILYTQL